MIYKQLVQNYKMYSGPNAIIYMSQIMSKDKVDLDTILYLVDVVNKSYFQCQNVVTILDDIFQREKSNKILQAVEVLQYLIKNCNKNFHQAANKQSFQKKILSLLKRVRGKSNFLKDLRSNTENWNKIEAKILYLIQLWYDAFILEENVYNHIINNYKILRKEGIMFPPRSINEKNILFIQTQSPILQNIEDIARQDHQKFNKKLKNMKLQKLSDKMQLIEKQQIKVKKTRKIDIDQISQRIAIVRSNSFQGKDMIVLIQEVKKDLQYGVVSPQEQIYWKDIKQAAEILIEDWQKANAQFIKDYQRQYLQKKMGMKKQQKQLIKSEVEDEFGQFESSPQKKQQQKKKVQQTNLIDLL